MIHYLAKAMNRNREFARYFYYFGFMGRSGFVLP